MHFCGRESDLESQVLGGWKAAAVCSRPPSGVGLWIVAGRGGVVDRLEGRVEVEVEGRGRK